MSGHIPPYDRNDIEHVDTYDAELPEDGDHKVLEQMIARGTNLALPRHTVYYLYFENLEAARSAAQELSSHGYEAKSGMPSQIPTRNIWPVIAEKIVVVNEASVTQDRVLLTSVAERYGGEYDGWEAALD